MQDIAIVLAENELLLLFVVILLGLLLARLEFRGLKLGLAGVLFAGLGLSAWLTPHAPTMSIAPELKEFGLVLFVYCVGLTSGPGFFAAFKSRGLRVNLAVGTALACGALLTFLGGSLLGLDRGFLAGVFCGALTNTPALGAAGEQLAGTALAMHPVIGYSVTYPFGVLGALLSFRLFVVMMRQKLELERSSQRQSQRPHIATGNFRVTRTEVVGHSIGELEIRTKVGVVVSRLRRGREIVVPTKYSVLHFGDVVTVVGENRDLAHASEFFGEVSSEHLEVRRDHVDMRRVLVSRRQHVGRALSELDLARRFNAQVTRLRRADLDIVPSPDMRLELGDRLRVVAPIDRLKEVSAFFGDSERELADLDYIGLALGLCAGLVLARVPLPLFGIELSLGAAGGPLLVALLLGRLGRSGPLVWAIPFEANTTLRELGLLLFLAGVGTGAGGQLAGVMNQQGLSMLVLGALVTVVTALVALGLSYFWARTTVISSLGVSSGMQTQPATLAAAYDLSGRSEETYVAYALVYPVAMISKILFAQLLALFG